MLNNVFKLMVLVRTNSTSKRFYAGWPRKNVTLSITKFKEIRNLIKLVSAVMSKTFFFQQNDTNLMILMKAF